jgi:hypothetical protein
MLNVMVHIVTPGHYKVKILSVPSILVGIHTKNFIKFVKLSQSFQFSERSTMLQSIVTNVCACARVYTCVCMYGIRSYDIYLK